jgi:integration host factor subunit alpha
MSLNKDRLTEIISGKYGLSKKRSTELIEHTLEIIKQRLAEGEDILISGFGKFCVKDKRERRGRNPARGNELILESRRVVTFRCSSVLKAKLNGKG